jgi:hypothetical protein
MQYMLQRRLYMAEWMTKFNFEWATHAWLKITSTIYAYICIWTSNKVTQYGKSQSRTRALCLIRGKSLVFTTISASALRYAFRLLTYVCIWQRQPLYTMYLLYIIRIYYKAYTSCCKSKHAWQCEQSEIRTAGGQDTLLSDQHDRTATPEKSQL